MGKLIVVISLVALLIPGVASANLLLNPGFESTGESGHTTNWSNAAPDGWNNNIFGAQDNPQSGAWHARNSNDGGLWQDVAITGGESYKLTGWVYIPAGVGGSPWGSTIGFKWIRANGTSTGSSWETSFQSLTRDQYNQGDSGYRVAPADAVTARVKFGTWANDPWDPVKPTDFDDFDFSPIPEPTSLLLLGSGLVGLVGLTKRKKA